MSEQLATPFTIEAATEADVSEIGRVHRQAALDAYPNAAAGVDEAKVRAVYDPMADPSGDDYRRLTIRRVESHPEHELYDVAKNAQGQVVGFIHATRANQEATLEGLYVASEAWGTGASDQLMEEVLRFAGDLPMKLQVVDYNDRAIGFYERHGFAEVPDSADLMKGLPVISMRRQPPEVSHEV